MVDKSLAWLNIRIMEYQHEYEMSSSPREKKVTAVKVYSFRKEEDDE